MLFTNNILCYSNTPSEALPLKYDAKFTFFSTKCACVLALHYLNAKKIIFIFLWCLLCIIINPHARSCCFWNIIMLQYSMTQSEFLTIDLHNNHEYERAQKSDVSEQSSRTTTSSSEHWQTWWVGMHIYPAD